LNFTRLKGSVREKYLAVAKEAASHAGHFLIENLGKSKDVNYKGSGYFNPVSAVDTGAECIIVDAVSSAFPEHNIVAEEKGGATQSAYTWLIDPLDGTINYLHGYQHFCVSLALIYKGELVLGVVYNPVLGEMFSALNGQGAYLNDRIIRVSREGQVSKSLFSVGLPYERDSRDFQDNLECFGLLAMTGQAVRREGSTALSLCNVACGRFDGFCVIANEVWDYAAGVLLVREAGGMVTDFQGQTFRIPARRNRLLATNGLIHEAVLKKLHDTGIY